MHQVNEQSAQGGPILVALEHYQQALRAGVLEYALALCVDCSPGLLAAQVQGQLPAQIERVLEAQVETLATGGQVNMNCVSREEDPPYLIVSNLARGVAEARRPQDSCNSTSGP